MIWSILVLLLKALVVVWGLLLVVFALGFSLMSRRSRSTSGLVAATDRVDGGVLEADVEKPAA